MTGEDLEVITFDLALRKASRLLHAAELETNLAAMERIEALADSWVSIARLMTERDH